MTPEELAIHGKLKSRWWRLNNLYWIENEQGKKLKFRLNWAQKAFLAAMWWLNVILKARQLGMSTLMQIYMLDSCLFGRNKTAGIIDKTDDDATKKLARIKFAYENLDCPDPCDGVSTAALGALIKQSVTLETANDHELEWSNSSKIWAGTSLRGGTLQILHISELGYIAFFNPKKAKEIRSGALNTVHEGAVVVIESTHEGGKAGLNYEMIVLAQESGPELTTMDWKFHFFAWWRDPKYRLEGAPRVIDPELLTYFDELFQQGIKLDEAQKAWYAAKKRTQKDDMKKEFPSTPEEALNAVVRGAIYGTLISQARAQGRVCDFNRTEGLPCYVSWDIGISDFADLWLIQPVGRQVTVLDFYENNGEGAGHYADVVREWERKHNIKIALNLLPHDAAKREFGTGLSVVQQLSNLGLPNCVVVPRTSDIWAGINAVRSLLPNMVFHKTNTSKERVKDGKRYPAGLNALEGYRTQDESSSAVLKEMPVHDECSHPADALRTFAEAFEAGMISNQFAGPTIACTKPDITVKTGVGMSNTQTRRFGKIRVKR